MSREVFSYSDKEPEVNAGEYVMPAGEVMGVYRWYITKEEEWIPIGKSREVYRRNQRKQKEKARYA